MKKTLEINGLTFSRYSDLIGHVLKLPKDEQEKFVEAYAKTGPYALQNLGYISGYYDDETCLKIQEIFKTAHPIFGNRIPTTEEAFEAGKKLGKKE